MKTNSAVTEPIAVDPAYMTSEITPNPATSSVHAAIQQSIREMNPSTNRAMAGSRHATQQEKARALFEKYGMKFEPSDWHYPGVPSGDRIEKPIRMRVRRTCHRCHTLFGRDKACSNCGHPRCKTCPRYPVKKPKGPKAKGTGTGAAAGLGVDELKNGAAESGSTQQDKARALFEKYGLKLEPHEWQSPVSRPFERVEKPIRMRVRRHCHRCQTTFGSDKVCSSCNHTRCKKCPRYPLKKKKDIQSKETNIATSGMDEAGGKTEGVEQTKAKMKTKPQPLTILRNGKELVRRKPRQTVRRTCHLCECDFARGDKTCASCQHVRCKMCPRDPAKLHKYPDGYPGDAEPPPELYPPLQRQYRKTRTRVKWTCHSCSTFFKEKSKTCEKCNHERCDDCTRFPYADTVLLQSVLANRYNRPKKVTPAPHPAIIQSLEQKIGKLKISLEEAAAA